MSVVANSPNFKTSELKGIHNYILFDSHLCYTSSTIKPKRIAPRCCIRLFSNFPCFLSLLHSLFHGVLYCFSQLSSFHFSSTSFLLPSRTCFIHLTNISECLLCARHWDAVNTAENEIKTSLSGYVFSQSLIPI